MRLAVLVKGTAVAGGGLHKTCSLDVQECTAAACLHSGHGSENVK